MEDLIPLFIVILIGIVGALSRKKRKRLVDEEIVKPRQQSTNDDLFSWLNKLNVEDVLPSETTGEKSFVNDNDFFKSGEQEKVPVVEEAPASGKFSGYSGVITEEEKTQLMAKEGVSALPNNNDNVAAEKSDGHDEKIKQPKFRKTLTNFDLKKAVIYSEVLNRKYGD